MEIDGDTLRCQNNARKKEDNMWSVKRNICLSKISKKTIHKDVLLPTLQYRSESLVWEEINAECNGNGLLKKHVW